MEKAKVFLFYHGEKVGLAVVVVFCLLGLWLTHPWAAAGSQDFGLKQDLGSLQTKVKAGTLAAGQFAHPDFVAQLAGQLGPREVQAFPAAIWPTVDISQLPEERQNYPRLAAVVQVQVVPERGGLKVTWSTDPQKQAVENAQARCVCVIELVRAVIYRATAEAPNQLQELGTVSLDDVVVVPATSAPARPGAQRFVGGAQPEAALLTVPEGKMSAEDAVKAGRFSYADRAVKTEQDYVYKVKLVAKNPVYDAANPGVVPEFIESDVQAATLSLAQRPLPSIRWFFMGGNDKQVSVRVYKWHVFSVAAGELSAAASLPSTPVAPAAVTPPSAAAPVAGGTTASRAAAARAIEASRAAAAATARTARTARASGTPAPARPPVVARPAVAAVAPVGVATPTGGEAAGAQEMVERGEWVVKDFSVRPGDPIGSEIQGYFSPGGVGKPEQLTMDFSTGCTVVAVEMALRISDAPVVTLTAAGAPSRLIKDSLLLYFIDPSGALRTRWQEPDLVLAEELTAPAPTTGAAPGAAAATKPAAGRQISSEEYTKRMQQYTRQQEAADRASAAAVQRAMEQDRARQHPQNVEEGGGPPGF